MKLSIVLLALLGASTAAATPLAPDRQREILDAALHAFDAAAEQSRTNPTHATRLYREAAAGFDALADSGIASAALEYNRGNTQFRLGQLGRAILHYRRALALNPRDAQLRANLEYVRGQVTPPISAAARGGVVRSLLAWHYDTSAQGRFWVAAALSAAGWLTLLILVFFRRRAGALVALGLVLAAIGAAAGGSLLWQQYDERHHPHAVVISGEHILRLGRGESYQPALKQPLGPGVELRILSTRGDWVEVRLTNDQTGWLPATAVERV